MKISRLKKSHKTLVFFSNNFNYHEPYQILIDGTFCQAALQHKVIIDDQLRKYFQTEVKLLTTQCIILEVESLGGPLVGAAQIVKKFAVHKCGHEGKPITAAECIKSMTRDSRYIVATQDRSLQQSLRKIPGRCLLYLHRAAPVLEAPSIASKKCVQKKAKNLLPTAVNERIVQMKQAKGLPIPAARSDGQNKKKHKGPKNPNPLSCKKSKKQAQMKNQSQQAKATISEKSKPELKPKRKRIKLPAHIKEAIKSSS